MKLIEKLYKATMEAKRAIELPFVVRQTERILDEKVRAFDAATEDAELDLKRLYTELAEADKGEKGSVFNRIVEKKIEIEEAGKIAKIAAEVRTELFAEAEE